MAARPENIGVVRHVLDVLTEIGMDRAEVADIRLAVTEACSNVVRHAYDDTPGPMEVVVGPIGDALAVTVSDRGRGGVGSRDDSGPHFGLTVMTTVSQSIEVEQHVGTGSRVSMYFPLDPSPRDAVNA